MYIYIHIHIYIYTYIYIYAFTEPLYTSRIQKKKEIFKWSLTSLNSEFSIS